MEIPFTLLYTKRLISGRISMACDEVQLGVEITQLRVNLKCLSLIGQTTITSAYP